MPALDREPDVAADEAGCHEQLQQSAEFSRSRAYGLVPDAELSMRRAFGVREAGSGSVYEWRTHSPGVSHQVEMPDGLLILMTLRGASRVDLADTDTLELRGSCALLLASPVGRAGARVFERGAGREIAVHFPLEAARCAFGFDIQSLIEAHCVECGSGRGGGAIVELPESIAHAARSLFDYTTRDSTCDLIAEAQTWLLLCQLIELLRASSSSAIASHISKRTGELTDRAAALLRRRPESPHTLRSLGRSVGLSRSTLAAAFRVRYGMTLCEFLRRQRMEKAMVLLKDGDLSVAEVASASGYGDVSSFTRAFRHYHKTTPAIVRSEEHTSELQSPI